MKDRFHIGEEAAEAQGTWSRGFGRRQMREEEEQEAQDEAETLVDQKNTTAQSLPGIQIAPPGLGSLQTGSGSLLPGIGAPQPAPQAGMSASMPQMDPGRLAAILSQQNPSQPQNFPSATGIPGFPMPPAMSGTPPLNIDLAELQKQLLSQGISPQNFASLAASLGSAGLPGLQSSTPDNTYRR